MKVVYMIWSSKGRAYSRHEPHSHDMHEIFICLNDCGEQYIGGQKCAFSPGRAFFLFSGVGHFINCNEKNEGEFILFCFDPEYFLSRETPAIDDHIKRLAMGKNYFSGTDPAYLAENLRLAAELHYEIDNPGVLSQEKITALLSCLIINFSRSQAWVDNDKSAEDDSRIALLCRRIRKKPMEEYRLKSAAEDVAMSRSKFAVKIKEFTGMSLMEYVIEFRLKHACELLGEGDISVWDAAMQSGFNNAGYFHRQFKRRYGITPLQMKQRYTATRFPKILKEY